MIPVCTDHAPAARWRLSHFGLLDSVAVGETGTMKDIVRLVARADRVLTI